MNQPFFGSFCIIPVGHTQCQPGVFSGLIRQTFKVRDGRWIGLLLTWLKWENGKVMVNIWLMVDDVDGES